MQRKATRDGCKNGSDWEQSDAAPAEGPPVKGGVLPYGQQGRGWGKGETKALTGVPAEELSRDVSMKRGRTVF